MEDHFLLFPIMVVVGLCYAAWYVIRIVWILILLIYKLFINIISKREVKNSNVAE